MAGIARWILLILQIVVYILHSVAGAALYRDPRKRTRFHALTTSFWAHFTLWFLGVKVRVKGRENMASDHKALLVSNHMGYMDIIVISHVTPTLFITSMDVKRAFFLGLMSTLGGSLFVDRRNKSRLLEEISEIAETIKRGNSVTLFPEGTSGNGDEVMRFKQALFAVCEREGFVVSPMCLTYHTIGGRPITARNRDRLFYYGPITFFPHIFGIPFLGSVEVTLEFLPPIKAGAGQTRKDIADQCHAAISEAYRRNREADAAG